MQVAAYLFRTYSPTTRISSLSLRFQGRLPRHRSRFYFSISSNECLKRSGMSSPKSTREKAEPRLSASLLLLDHKHDVLMIQRMRDSRTFAGMHAFPGGGYDAAQDGLATDPRMTAIRETFEETGILLATPISPSLPPPSPSQISFARRAIHSRTDPTTFTSFLAEHNLSVTSTQKCLIPFTQWITPVAAKSRFWTWFYVAFLDEMEGVLAAGDVEIGPSSGNVLSSVLEKLAPTPVPTSDNHVEIQSAYFQSPRAIIQAFDQGDITLMPPQFYLLTMLADTLDRHRAERKKREEDRLAAGYMRDIVGRKFGGRVFNPRFGGKIIGEDGVERSVLMYEGDGRYGKGLAGDGNNNDVKESGRQDSVLAKHRSLLTFINGLTDPLLPPCVSLHVFSVHELSSLKEQSIFWDWTPNPGLVDDPRSYDDDVRSSFKWKSLRLVSRGQVGYYHTLDLPSTSLDVRRRPGADPFGPVTCT